MFYASTISRLETQLGSIQRENNKSIQFLKFECEQYKSKMNELGNKLETVNM